MWNSVDEITKKLIKLKYVSDSKLGSRDYSYIHKFDKATIDKVAKKIAEDRGYSAALSQVNIPIR